MKRFKSIFQHFRWHYKAILLVFVCVCISTLSAKGDNVDYDSLEISLLTCEPHQEIYALYGHTALRVHDLRPGGQDFAINYGVFDFDAPNFEWRFIMGTSDYSVEAFSFALFKAEYVKAGSKVTEQVLNLTATEKQKIMTALYINLLPGNKNYRYNYFFDNCTTRARNLIASNLDATVNYNNDADGKERESFRELIHGYNGQYPWARFGNDILLGYPADKPTKYDEWQFLPKELMNDFATATLQSDTTKERKLVKETRTVVKAGKQKPMSEFPLRPSVCFIILLAITMIITAVEWVKKKLFWIYDALLMAAVGLCGILLFLMIFSHHPTVSLNFQLLLLNPLPLFFGWFALRDARRGKVHWYLYLSLLLIILFFTCGLLQHYAEGMYFLALSLLIRVVTIIMKYHKMAKKVKVSHLNNK